jgi:hypothetical protein
LTSTDYWPDKLVNNKNILSKSTPDNIFSRDEIEKLVEIADKNGFKLTEPIDFQYKDKVVRWNSIGLDFTFIFFAMRKKSNETFLKILFIKIEGKFIVII